VKIDSNLFRLGFEEKLDLTEKPTSIEPLFKSARQYKKILKNHVKDLSALQRLHYAADRCALLLIFQGMDTAGKDGVIRQVMSGINPQGVKVWSFKEPSNEELRHDFLWRTTNRLPERGQIAIYNRSYYEEVVVVRVHPELLLKQKIPDQLLNKETFWMDRYRSITDFEEHLHRNGTHVVKIFLHLSKDEQAKRLVDRIDSPEKNWKVNNSDFYNRDFWDSYMKAYETCLNATSSEDAPWFIVPADNKENARLIVSQVVLDWFRGLNLEYPTVTEIRRQELLAFRSKL